MMWSYRSIYNLDWPIIVNKITRDLSRSIDILHAALATITIPQDLTVPLYFPNVIITVYMTNTNTNPINIMWADGTKNMPLSVKLGQGRSWYKQRLWFLNFKRFVRMVFSKFLCKGLHWHGSKRFNSHLTWDVWLNSDWCCTSWLIILAIK